MFRSPIKRAPTNLEAVIEDVYTLMQRHNADTDEYDLLLCRLERLETLKNNSRSTKRISPDTLVTVGGHFAMVVVIVAYENRHVMTSKALGIIQKLI